METQPRKVKVYAIGYGGRSLDEICAKVEECNGTIVDIRFGPRSGNPSFRKKNLELVLGSRYIYCQEFGNKNYRGEGEVQLVDYDGGRAKLSDMTTAAILLCGCRDATNCHRTTVLERLRRDGFETQELGH